MSISTVEEEPLEEEDDESEESSKSVLSNSKRKRERERKVQIRATKMACKRKRESVLKREVSDQPSVTSAEDTTETPEIGNLSANITFECKDQAQIVSKAAKDQNEETRGNKTSDIKEFSDFVGRERAMRMDESHYSGISEEDYDHGMGTFIAPDRSILISLGHFDD